jgi:hypothetical protein
MKLSDKLFHTVRTSVGLRSFPTASITALVIIGICSLVSLFSLQVPAVGRDGISESAFSSVHALQLVQSLATKPHPLASDGEIVVRNFILSEIRRLGLEPSLQETVLSERVSQGRYIWARVQNIVVRVSGYASTKTVLLMAHYDTAASSPGASDDSSGVATLLETCRVLQSTEPLRNDVVFLFTDGEEDGLLGAKSFLSQHPLGQNIGLVLNFEARGTSGPSFLFETTSRNGWLIQELAGLPHPRASSLFFELYKHMPYGTDLSVFRERGVPGLNFAFVEHPLLYHTSADDVTHLDIRSLKHQGDYAVWLTRKFGNIDLRVTPEANEVFFNTGDWLLHYPESYVLPLAFLNLFLLVLAAVLAIRMCAVRFSGFMIGIAMASLLATTAFFLGMMSWLVLRQIVPEFRDPGFVLFFSWWYVLAGASSVIAAAIGLLLSVGRRINRLEIALGSLGFCFLLSIPLVFAAPGASYLLQWPCLAGLLSSFLYVMSDRAYWFGKPAESRVSPSMLTTFVCVISTAVAVLLISPVVYLFFVALGMLALVPAAVTVAVLLCLIMSGFLVAVHPSPRAAGLVALCFCLLLFVGGVFGSRYTQEQPKHNNLFYALNTDTRKAVWGTRDRAVDSWTMEIFGKAYRSSALPDFVPFDDLFKNVDAPVFPLTPPSITVLGHSTSENKRSLELWIRSQRDAKRMIVWSPAGAAPVLLTALDTRPIVELDDCAKCDADPFQVLVLDDVPPEGLKIQVELQAGMPLTLRLLDCSDQLPDFPAMPIPPRSGWMVRGMETPLLNDSTVVSRTTMF